MEYLTLENAGIVITSIVTICSAISSAVPSVGKFMAVVDALAFNWAKARNDSRVQ